MQTYWCHVSNSSTDRGVFVSWLSAFSFRSKLPQDSTECRMGSNQYAPRPGWSIRGNHRGNRRPGGFSGGRGRGGFQQTMNSGDNGGSMARHVVISEPNDPLNDLRREPQQTYSNRQNRNSWNANHQINHSNKSNRNSAVSFQRSIPNGEFFPSYHDMFFLIVNYTCLLVTLNKPWVVLFHLPR